MSTVEIKNNPRYTQITKNLLQTILQFMFTTKSESFEIDSSYDRWDISVRINLKRKPIKKDEVSENFKRKLGIK